MSKKLLNIFEAPSVRRIFIFVRGRHESLSRCLKWQLQDTVCFLVLRKFSLDTT